jgi:lipoprotein-releasing system permease protein
LYKLLLCWRYLLTRYLALVCIVSVMLGVATLIVVNSVMSGFSTKLRDRLHGLLSDIVIEAENYNGMEDYEGLMADIRADAYLNGHIEAMTPTLEIFAMIQFTYGGQPFMRPVRLIGIEPEGRARVGGFGEHLLLAKDKAHPSFEPSRECYEHYLAGHPRLGLRQQPEPEVVPADAVGAVLGPTARFVVKPPPPPPDGADQEPDRLPERIILGYAIAHFPDPDSTPEDPRPDRRTLQPGDEVILTTVNGVKLESVSARFVVSDYIKTEMSEYDSNYVYVPLHYLQRLRTLEHRATSIQIRLKDERDAKEVVDRLKPLCARRMARRLHGDGVYVMTWEQKQGPLLSAIAIEKGMLNVLLFMIILVAGFGILAIFSMIVVEKTRDIGILKALGASNGGVMKIFLAYGLLLGTVGAVCGTALGITITVYINQIEHAIALATGQQLFDRHTYYFNEIPTNIQPLSVALVNVGAVGIAVLFSVLPALRAAMLHPVRALRYE